jgi:uncharacterized membrane protein
VADDKRPEPVLPPFTDRFPHSYCFEKMIPSFEDSDQPPRPDFERVLSPHRSLPVRNFHLLMGLLGVMSLAVGIGFLAIGAWPVIGFFGLDVALVYVAFRLSYRSARQSETFCLGGNAFTVERVNVRGERRKWQFEPFWLRVILEERPDTSNRLLVASHGRSLVIGDFVSPATRRELAGTIREALAHWRNSLNRTACRY